ncbi:hypothetical protein GCM10027261_02130 [Geodermatophilus arenarius]|uniref:Uncharacterized protein n=1 Tax=Geodermatophilus arenarius TaxID=1137990 RepID=A0ABV9LE22_9ACTN
MTTSTERPPTAVEQPAAAGPPAAAEQSQRPADDAATPLTPEKRGIEERGWLLFAIVVTFIVLAFAGMIVLTALGGGTTYVPWNG